MYHTAGRGDHFDMSTNQPQPKFVKVVAAALQPGRSAHQRQRDLVRASLLVR
jgi:hypothetical protein